MTSPLDRLSQQLGTRWTHLSEAAERTEDKRVELEKALKGLTNEDTSIVVFGSLARGEVTVGSDVDWTLLVDGLADPHHLDVAREVNQQLQGIGEKRPGVEGIFGNLAFSHELVHHIGGGDDTNSNTTQRLLLLLESEPIGSREAYDRVVRAVLRRYINEDGTFDRGKAQYLVPRFLLNDFARYWRTVAVDFAYKRKTRAGKGAPLRNLKLRMSRKLIYASGLLACYWCQLGLAQNGPCSEERSPQACVECLREFMGQTPLEILALIFARAPHLGTSATAVFDAYDGFLGALGDKDRREHLSRLSLDETWDDAEYQEVHQLTRDFHHGLVDLFFDEQSELLELTKRYGVF